MNHFLITRFNVGLYDNAFYSGHPSTHFSENRQSNQDKWFHERLNLFENSCFLSVNNQTNKRFEWWWFLDEKTPKPFRERIDSIISRSKVIVRVFYISGPPAGCIRDNFGKFIRSSICDSNWIITTRLDNDDVINKNMIESIQKSVVLKHRHVLSFKSGYRLWILNGGILKLQSFYMTWPNQFSSMVEDITNGPILSVYARKHPNLGKDNFATVNYIDSDPMWIWVMHEEQTTNDVNGEIAAGKSTSLKMTSNIERDFGINLWMIKMTVQGHL